MNGAILDILISQSGDKQNPCRTDINSLKQSWQKKKKKKYQSKGCLKKKNETKQNKTKEKVRKSKKTLVENDESSVKNTA